MDSGSAIDSAKISLVRLTKPLRLPLQPLWYLGLTLDFWERFILEIDLSTLELDAGGSCSVDYISGQLPFEQSTPDVVQAFLPLTARGLSKGSTEVLDRSRSVSGASVMNHIRE
jgi:hypothetical protein